MPKYKRVLLKLSGEALKNSSKDGIIDFDFVAKVAKQIKRCTDEGVSFGIVIGGGNIWRGAGKSIDRTRADHGLFIGFSHYESRDDIALAVRIPFGYSSINAELVAKDILDYYYGLSDDILSGQANSNGVASVRAD